MIIPPLGTPRRLKHINAQIQYVIRFAKRGLPHTFNVPTLMIHNIKFIDSAGSTAPT